MKQSQSQNIRQQQLKDSLSQLEQRVNDLRQEELSKKKRNKSINAAEKQQRILTLSQHIQTLHQVQELVAQDAIIEDSQWSQFVQMLDSLYQNLDNPEFEADLNQRYAYLLSRRPVNIERFGIRPVLKSIEQFDQQIQNKASQMVDQTNAVYKLKLMEASYNDRPQGSDYYPPLSFKEKLNLRSLLPKYKMLPHTIFTKLSIETLFYVFYHNKDASEQQLAARELRRQKWMFNRKHGIWLKKQDGKQYEENDKYIKGPFVYFDEGRWQQKRKPEFKFKLQYLDDQQYQ